MFRTDLLSIIRSLDTVYTEIGICHTEILKMDTITGVYNKEFCVLHVQSNTTIFYLVVQ